MQAAFATHYYLPDRAPFLNLSDLDADATAAVYREMALLRAAGKQHRPFGRRYTEWRSLTEKRLRELFVARGGRPERDAPHYFVFGESPWFEHLADGMRAIRVPLASLPHNVTSVTVPDSFTAMEFGERFGFPAAPNPSHGRVFLLDELDEVVAEFGNPAPSWQTRHVDWQEWPAAAYIEIQLWSDAPVLAHLT